MRSAARAIIIHHQNILVMKRNKFGTVYYTLVGGGIDMGETADQALLREIKEETGLTVANPRLTYIEQSNDLYGTQYIFVADYVDGDVKIDPSSIEAKLNAAGQNLFEPMWVPISKFASLPFRSVDLQKEILAAVQSGGFPNEPKTFTSQAEIDYTKSDKKET